MQSVHPNCWSIPSQGTFYLALEWLMRNKPARCQLENKGKNSPKTINREIYSLLPDVEVIAENYSTLIRMQEKHVSKKGAGGP